VTIGMVLREARSLETRFVGRFFVLGLVVFAVVNLAYALGVEALASDSDGAAAVFDVATAVICTTLPRFLEILVGGTIAQAVVAPFVAISLAITYFPLREAHGDTVPAEPAP
jgi:hypothetical protein